jgi:hypothetical protein
MTYRIRLSGMAPPTSSSLPFRDNWESKLGQARLIVKTKLYGREN